MGSFLCFRQFPHRIQTGSPSTYGSAQDNLVYIAYAQMRVIINAHANASSRARGRNFSPSLHLQLYFVYASSEGSGESAHMHKLT